MSQGIWLNITTVSYRSNLSLQCYRADCTRSSGY